MGLDGTHHGKQARIEPQKAHHHLELRLSSFVLFYPCISLMSVRTSSYACFPQQMNFDLHVNSTLQVEAAED